MRKLVGHHYRSGREFLKFLANDTKYALTHRDWIRRLPQWWHSLDPYIAPTFEPLPWLSYAATEWLQQTINKSMRVFEYGAGSSTLFFSTYCASVVSVEHDPEWANKLKSLLGERSNVDLRLIQPEPLSEPGSYSDTSYTSVAYPQLYSGLSFEKYVRCIEEFPDRHFDLVLIDGRSRASCLKCALPKVAAGGYLLLDNSERSEYQEARALLQAYPLVEIYGVAPRVGSHSAFSAWRIT
jgi:hypothetical protein